MFLSSMVYGSLVTSVVRRLPCCRLHRLSARRHRCRCLRLSRHLRGRHLRRRLAADRRRRLTAVR